MKSTDPNQSPGSREPGGTTGENTGGRILDAGREAMSGATDDVRSRMERGKSTAAETAAGASEVLEHAAEDFSEHGQDTLARATHSLADKLSELAGQLERRSIDDLAQEAMRLARRNPGMFIAGGVALGLALSRFIKASASHDYSEGSAGGWDRGGAAYGTEGAVPEAGYQGYEGYGFDEAETSLEQGVGASMDETPIAAGSETGGEPARGPARAPSTSSNPMGGAGGQHE